MPFLTSARLPTDAIVAPPAQVPSRVQIVGAPVSAFPLTKFTQEEIGSILQIKNPTVKKLLANPHIQTRHLYLQQGKPSAAASSPGERHSLFLHGIKDIGFRAVSSLMHDLEIQPKNIDVVTAVTSTGLALPGVSAMLARQFDFRPDIQRMDLVGMGCNAGLSGLRTLSMATRDISCLRGRPAYGLLLCCEINSAICLNDETTGAGIVNALFGDGAVALLVRANCGSIPRSTLQNEPSITFCTMLDFESHTVPEYFDDMTYSIDGKTQLMRFNLSKRIPSGIAEAAVAPIESIIIRNNIKLSQIKHWVVHGGGAAVAQGLCQNLLLDPQAFAHTESVLKDYGNLSSCSFLVSLERLLAKKGSVQQGDYVTFVAMGPGATIEVALGVF